MLNSRNKELLDQHSLAPKRLTFSRARSAAHWFSTNRKVSGGWYNLCASLLFSFSLAVKPTSFGIQNLEFSSEFMYYMDHQGH